MTTARKELLDFFESANPPAVRIEQLTAEAYKQGVAEGREQIENEKQDSLENWLLGMFLFGVAVGGSVVFFLCLRAF